MVCAHHLSSMCRASKSAQNQLSKCMAIEFARRKQNIAVMMLHPGTVDTDLSQPFQKVRAGISNPNHSFLVIEERRLFLCMTLHTCEHALRCADSACAVYAKAPCTCSQERGALHSVPVRVRHLSNDRGQRLQWALISCVTTRVCTRRTSSQRSFSPRSER